MTLLYSSLYLKCTLWHFLARYFIEYGLAKFPNFICSGINQSLSSNILSDIWKPVWRDDWFVFPLKTESEFSVFVVRWAIFLSFLRSVMVNLHSQTLFASRSKACIGCQKYSSILIYKASSKYIRINWVLCTNSCCRKWDLKLIFFMLCHQFYIFPLKNRIACVYILVRIK